MAKSKEELVFDSVDEVNDSALAQIPEDKQKPMMGGHGWSDWVLSHLEDDEKDKKTGLPKTEGLGRLVPLLIGDIIKSDSNPHACFQLNDHGDFAVFAKHTLVVKTHDGVEKEFGAIGEASVNNADKPFCKYPGSVAATRARGRTYRDCLMIKTCTVEELSQVAETSSSDPDDTLPLNDAQKAGIKTMCKKNGIDVDKFIQMGPFPHKSLDKVLRGTAQRMLSVLNGYQNGREIPEEIKL